MPHAFPFPEAAVLMFGKYIPCPAWDDFSDFIVEKEIPYVLFDCVASMVMFKAAVESLAVAPMDRESPFPLVPVAEAPQEKDPPEPPASPAKATFVFGVFMLENGYADVGRSRGGDDARLVQVVRNERELPRGRRDGAAPGGGGVGSHFQVYGVRAGVGDYDGEGSVLGAGRGVRLGHLRGRQERPEARGGGGDGDEHGFSVTR